MTHSETHPLTITDRRLRRLIDRMPPEAVHRLADEVLRQITGDGRDRVVADAAAVEEFCDRLLDLDPSNSARLIDSELAAGQGSHDIHKRLLSPAAILLGQRWDEDLLTVLQVTIASGRILSLSRHVRMADPPPRAVHPRSVALAAAPGETHFLGVTMVADQFRRAGWPVDLFVGMEANALIDAVGRSGATIVGLSAGSRATAPALARTILGLRLTCPHLPIMIGGRIAIDNPKIVQLMEPDAICTTPEEAMDIVQTIMDDRDT